MSIPNAATPLRISDLRDVLATPNGESVLLKAISQAGEQRSVVEIAITTDLAPAVALALLTTTAQARSARDGREPALEPLVIGVGASQPDTLRLELLFEKAVLLPVEISLPAARALAKALQQALGN